MCGPPVLGDWSEDASFPRLSLSAMDVYTHELHSRLMVDDPDGDAVDQVKATPGGTCTVGRNTKTMQWTRQNPPEIPGVACLRGRREVS
jgi:hypothetical protein